MPTGDVVVPDAVRHTAAPGGRARAAPHLTGRNPPPRPLVFGQITHIAELAELPVDP
ncbi:hypothetical protein ABT288_38150 [Streptomyces sp. NPDC001093]|uniref:hypothetical protein n=1 Tax=Streptomyces sp. NPDC001093 TaxID=3154376 RepID=UPI00331E4862